MLCVLDQKGDNVAAQKKIQNRIADESLEEASE